MKRTKKIFKRYAVSRINTSRENYNASSKNKRQAEEALRKSEGNLRAIFNHVDYALVLLDKSLIVLSCNEIAKAWSELAFGVRMREGDSIRSIVCKELEMDGCDILKSILEGRSNDEEISYKLMDGSVEWFRVRMNPLVDEEGVVGLCISAANITPRKVAEMEKIKVANDLIQHNKDLEQFAYIVSHNIRAQVANIIGLTEELNYESHVTAVKKIFARELALSAKRLDSILLDLNQILKAKREISEKKQIVNLPQLTASIRASLKSLIYQEQVSINVNFEISEISTLSSYIHSIFFNLITNSIKYRSTERAVLIDISSKKVEGDIIICFRDNGTGIDLNKKREQIFGLYKRFHPHIEGKGIGLFMVKTQVETLGGKISVDSEVNKGTEFVITLPSL